jgi:ppGpp synthetase/RelA/SpoT-type nucleotidyltranferase
VKTSPDVRDLAEMTSPNIGNLADKLAEILAKELLAECTREFAKFETQQVNVVWRVKSKQSILQKLHKGPPHRTSAGEPAINDYIGLRATVFHVGMVDHAIHIIEQWAVSRGLRLLEFVNSFSSPAYGGYRSVHLDFELLHPEASGLTRGHGIEIQVTTYLQYFHSMVSHSFLYKDLRTKSDQTLSTKDLQRLSDQLATMDMNVAKLLSKE